MPKETCSNCGDEADQLAMIATPECEWVCTCCFAEDPECYGFDPDLDPEDEL